MSTTGSQDEAHEASVVKQGWLYKRGSKTNAVNTGKWKRRYVYVLSDGRLCYLRSNKHVSPVGGPPASAKTIRLERCDVDIDHYARPTDVPGYAAGPLIVVSVLAAQQHHTAAAAINGGKMTLGPKEGELQFMAETEAEGWDWLNVIDYQVASSKRKVEQNIREGFEALRQFLKQQQSRYRLKGSTLTGAHAGRPPLQAQTRRVEGLDRLLSEPVGHLLHGPATDVAATSFNLRGVQGEGYSGLKPTGGCPACGGSEAKCASGGCTCGYVSDRGGNNPFVYHEFKSFSAWGSGNSGALLGYDSCDGTEPPPPIARSASSRSHSSAFNAAGFPEVRVPRLNIAILVVGTRGDVQPFIYLGRRLKIKEGHRVRIATHARFRGIVEEAGLLFYPLAGDPVKLSEYMVRNHGRLIPDLLDHHERQDIPEKMAMLRDIIESTWPACTAPDPEDPAALPFTADAIISNPVTYGHIHVAEALAVPLHLMFPQPWSPTHAFPHPLSSLPYDRCWSWENYVSYYFVEEFQWLCTERFINRFRASLGLDPIRRGEAGANLLVDNEVPFVKMWSPSLVPKPHDWGAHIDVSGYFLGDDLDDLREEDEARHTPLQDDWSVTRLSLSPPVPHATNDAHSAATKTPFSSCATTTAPCINAKSNIATTTDTATTISTGNPFLTVDDGDDGIIRNGALNAPLMATAADNDNGHDKEDCTGLPADLAHWLRSGPAPVFVGFGSMVIANTSSVVSTIVEASHLAGARILLQSSWAQLNTTATHTHVFCIGEMSHALLMPHMAAVIHHGGAGTTAAGLRAGLPTMICPFFGDQFFWGEMVRRANVGVAPVPVKDLTVPVLRASLASLLHDTDIRNHAKRMGHRLEAERGVAHAAEAFKRHLPLENMVCDVSLFQSETKVARVWCVQCGLKLSWEADLVIHQGRRKHHARHPYRFVDWGVVGPRDVIHGITQGCGGAAREIVSALTGVIEEPVRGALESGPVGAAQGLALGVVNLVRRPLRGGVILIDKVTTGICNEVERGLNGRYSLTRPKRYIFAKPSSDSMSWPCWGRPRLGPVTPDKDSILGPDVDHREILEAYLLARSAHRVYDRLTRKTPHSFLNDVAVWWRSFISLLQSRSFVPALAKSRDPHAHTHARTRTRCVAVGRACRATFRPCCSTIPEDREVHHGAEPDPSAVGWLRDWSTQQVHSYHQLTHQAAEAASAHDTNASEGGASSVLLSQGGASDAFPAKSFSSDGFSSSSFDFHGGRSELEAAITEALKLHPDQIQELASALEHAGMVGPGCTDADSYNGAGFVGFCSVFRTVVKRSNRLRRALTEPAGRQGVDGTHGHTVHAAHRSNTSPPIQGDSTAPYAHMSGAGAVHAHAHGQGGAGRGEGESGWGVVQRTQTDEQRGLPHTSAANREAIQTPLGDGLHWMHEGGYEDFKDELPFDDGDDFDGAFQQGRFNAESPPMNSEGGIHEMGADCSVSGEPLLPLSLRAAGMRSKSGYSSACGGRGGVGVGGGQWMSGRGVGGAVCSADNMPQEVRRYLDEQNAAVDAEVFYSSGAQSHAQPPPQDS